MSCLRVILLSSFAMMYCLRVILFSLIAMLSCKYAIVLVWCDTFILVIRYIGFIWRVSCELKSVMTSLISLYVLYVVLLILFSLWPLIFQTVVVLCQSIIAFCLITILLLWPRSIFGFGTQKVWTRRFNLRRFGTLDEQGSAGQSRAMQDRAGQGGRQGRAGKGRVWYFG